MRHQPTHRPDHQPNHQRGEAGALSVEFVLVMSVIVGLFMLMLAYGVRCYSKQVVTQAAQEGLAAAERYGATAAQGQAAAAHEIHVLGGDLSNVDIQVTYSGQTATVLVSGDAPTLVPLVKMHVATQVSAVIEQFAPPGATP